MSFILWGLEFWSSDYNAVYGNSELNVFKKIKLKKRKIYFLF